MRKTRKTKKFISFINGLHDFIVSHPQFRKNTTFKSERLIQAEIRPLIIDYLEDYFRGLGNSDFVAKAHSSFYWEGQEGKYGRERASTFASRNYPDFIITKPYLIAIEYKQSSNGSLVKQAIGQALMHTMSSDFDYVYVLFHDENKDKKIEKSLGQAREAEISRQVFEKFNVFLKFI